LRTGVKNVTIALPRLLGGNGVIETFPLPLNDHEVQQLGRSAQVIRDTLSELQQAR
jgi:L-lactate dehydrogenase